ncbi:MAG: YjjG family noncanonical pyrimidine nucleotidase [Cyclobacteriaceae bacterium]
MIFDLDHTLWDYDKNCAEALGELYEVKRLKEKGVDSFDNLLEVFMEMNMQMWDQYDLGIIQRDVIRYQRFHRILLKLGVDDYSLSLEMSSEYVALSPTKKNLLPNAMIVLDYLREKYNMLIITNGFDDIQATKLSSSGISNYFDSVITSETAGHKKPAKEIFEYAMKKGSYQPNEVIMIGDNLNTDIKGARNASIDSVYFNPLKKQHNADLKHEISDLIELKSIL